MVTDNYSFTFDLKQIVYLKTDKEQLERIITGINIRPCGVIYRVNYAEMESFHYDFEMTKDKDVVKSISN